MIGFSKLAFSAIEKCRRPVREALQQGLTPEKLALSVVAGATLGVFPIPGTTTLLCSLAAVRLRLNLPVIQIANYVVSPVQLLLMIPFLNTGATLFQMPALSLSPAEIVAAFQVAPWQMVLRFWQAMLGAVVVWVLICVPIVCMISALLPLLIRSVALQGFFHKQRPDYSPATRCGRNGQMKSSEMESVSFSILQ